MANNKRLIAEIIQNDEVIMTIDDNLLSAEFGALDRGSLTDVVDWGIYANRGSLSFIDNSGYFTNGTTEIEQAYSGKVKLYLAKETQSLVGTFKIGDVKIEESTKEVNISLESYLLDLQNESVPKTIYYIDPTPVSTLLKEVCPNIQISNDNELLLSRTYIYCTYIQSNISTWDALTRLCQVSMGRIFENENGLPTFDCGLSTKSSTIVIDLSNIIQFSNLDFSLNQNFSIDETHRKVYKNSTDENSVQTFSLYSSDGSLINPTDTETSKSATNSTLYTASINRTIRLPYKIYSVGSISGKGKGISKIYDADDNLQSKEYYNTDVNVTRLKATISSDNMSIKISGTLPNIKQTFSDGEGSWITELILTIPLTYYTDVGTLTITYNDNELPTVLPSNNLIQTLSDFEGISSGSVPLSTHILLSASEKYLGIVDCVECECLFNDYFDLDKNLILNSGNLEHFSKYDNVIPYTFKKGKRIPLRVNADGSPKIFKVIGMSYEYDGLLRQKLRLQVSK